MTSGAPEAADLGTVDRALRLALRENGRMSVSDLAQAVGLGVRASIAVTMMPTCTEAQEREVVALLERSPYVQECCRVTGDDYSQTRVVAPPIDQIEELVLQLWATQVVQNTRALLALEACFEKSALRLPPAG